MFEPYQKTIDLIEKLIIKENVPTKNPKGLATIAVLSTNYGAGDALAGVLLDKILAPENSQRNLSIFVEKATGKKCGRVGWVTLSNAFEELGKKYKVFYALNRMSVSGGHMDEIKKLEKEEL